MSVRVLVVISMLWGCREEPVAVEPPATPVRAPAPAAIKPVEAKPGPPKTPILEIVIVDRTNDGERPVDMGPLLPDLAKQAAASAGFKTLSSGLLAGVETHYVLTVGGEPKPDAEVGRLSWGVQITVRVEDEQGLGEDIIGSSKDSIPYVRGVAPNLAATCSHLLARALSSAFRDVWMQLQYREVSLVDAVTGLYSRELEERWAALRRLGEIGDPASVVPIANNMAGADEMTTYLAIGALGRIGGPLAFEHVSKIAALDNATLAMAAIETLTMIDAAKSVAVIKQVKTTHPDEEVRRFAREILARLSSGQ